MPEMLNRLAESLKPEVKPVYQWCVLQRWNDLLTEYSQRIEILGNGQRELIDNIEDLLETAFMSGFAGGMEFTKKSKQSSIT